MITASSNSTVLAVALALRQALADLDGHIERRATELAAPLIAKAGVEAAARIAEVAAVVQREQDVNAELRRILDIRDRQLSAQLTKERGGHRDRERRRRARPPL